MINKIKKYKLAIISFLGVLVVGIAIIFVMFRSYDKLGIKEYKNENYTFQYDSTWKLMKKTKDSVRLVRDKDSEVNIQVVSLEDEYKYSTSDEILDELLYSLEKQNTSYKLLTKEKDKITKYKYDGYKMLYENGKNQVYVAMGKAADKVLLVTYEASNSYFDILLDSVQNIIYDFRILDTSYKLSRKIDIKEGSIEWQDDGKLKDLTSTNDYQAATCNYLIKYSIPKNFKQQAYHTDAGYYKYEGSDYEEIDMSIRVTNDNIYDYLDKDGSDSLLHSKFSSERKGKDGEYTNFKEGIEEVKTKDNVKYVYKNSYNYESDYLKQKCENVYVIYEINKNHCICIEIEATDIKIPKELIDNIKIKSIKNYSSYIKRNIVDDKLIGELKDYVDNDEEITRTITLKLPTECEEIDHSFNLYEKRYYGLNINDKTQMYDYEIHYNGRDYSNRILDSLNSLYIEGKEKYGKYIKFTQSDDVTLNGKKFKLYTGGHTYTYGSEAKELAGETYYIDYKVLIYQYSESDNECLSITFMGNDVKISDDQLEKFANFDIEVK